MHSPEMVANSDFDGNNLPSVSLLIAVRNEASYIESCLTSIARQDYPENKLDVFILDGLSTDSTWQIVETLITKHPNFRLVSNPERIQSEGWNLGIQLSKSQVIGIVSGHSELALDYTSQAVKTLLRTGADLVGGPMRAISVNYLGQVIAEATSTPFGVGGARFHYTAKEEIVDTVYMGVCWRKVYENIGGFDRELVRNQDDELSYRLIKNGGRIICNPAIQSEYHNRSNLRSLWRQYFQYGYWKVRVLQKHPLQMRPRQFVPPLFAFGLIVSAILAILLPPTRWLLLAISAAYLLANLTASTFTAARKG